MSVDETRLEGLIEESQDLQSDALRDLHSSLPDLEEIGHQRQGVDRDEVRSFNSRRRTALRDGGYGLAALASSGLLATGLGATLAALVSTPASAQENLDVQILQTASSLEILAVATYGAALTLPFIKDGNATVVKFAETTMSQHDEHRQAFQAQTKALGGKEQTQPNPKYAPVVEQMKPQLKAPGDVVTLAATLEQVATETYLADLAMFSDTESKKIMASVMGVESQHLATLRAVGALLEANVSDLIAVPTDLAKLPKAAGSVSFPEPFEGTTKASPPAEGAVK